MSKVNTQFVASVKSFNGSADNPASPDKNGKMPVILDVVAGSCVNKRIISGTVAERAGLTVGKTYFTTCTETEPSEEYGRQFQFNAVMELGFSELLQATQTLGAPRVIDVTEKVNAGSEDFTE